MKKHSLLPPAFPLLKGLLISSLLSACALHTPYETPTMPFPEAWQEATHDKENEAPLSALWWQDFQSAELDRYAEEALRHNHDLAAAMARIEQAEASLKGTRAAFFPSLDGSASASDRHTRTPGIGTHSSNAVGVGLSAAYELDVFGSNRATSGVARANLQASRYAADTVKLSLLSETTNAYFTVLSFKERLTLSSQSLEAIKNILDIIQARYDAGRASALLLSQQKTSYATALASHAQLEQGLKTAENTLALLSGKPPQHITISGDNLNRIVIPSIHAGIPSEVLLRRPDLAQMEAQLMAAHANINLARSAFFPKVNLSAGWQATAESIGDPSVSVFSLAAGLTAPLFQGGRIRAGLEQATAREKELIATYYGLILQALSEVENALSGIQTAENRLLYYHTALTEAERSYTLSQQLYDAGSIDFQTLLDTQRSFLSAQESYLQARLDRLTAAVTLYRVLGGGFEKAA